MDSPTQEQIQDALILAGTNLCAWAKANDYKYTTVFNTVSRWSGRNDRMPHGGIARLIMRDLSTLVSESKVRNSSGKVANQSCELFGMVRNS